MRVQPRAGPGGLGGEGDELVQRHGTGIDLEDGRDDLLVEVDRSQAGAGHRIGQRFELCPHRRLSLGIGLSSVVGVAEPFFHELMQSIQIRCSKQPPEIAWRHHAVTGQRADADREAIVPATVLAPPVFCRGGLRLIDLHPNIGIAAPAKGLAIPGGEVEDHRLDSIDDLHGDWLYRHKHSSRSRVEARRGGHSASLYSSRLRGGKPLFLNVRQGPSR